MILYAPTLLVRPRLYKLPFLKPLVPEYPGWDNGQQYFHLSVSARIALSVQSLRIAIDAGQTRPAGAGPARLRQIEGHALRSLDEACGRGKGAEQLPSVNSNRAIKALCSIFLHGGGPWS
jgi:hypothetical protein